MRKTKLRNVWPEKDPIAPRGNGFRPMFTRTLRSKLGLVLALAALALALPHQVLALKGSASVKLRKNDGLAAGVPFQTNSLTEDYSLSQLIHPWHRFSLGADFMARRERNDGDTDGLAYDNERDALRPGLRIHYRTGPLVLGLVGGASRLDQFRNGHHFQRDDRLFSTFSSSVQSRSVSFSGHGQWARSWREIESAERESRDQVLSGSLRVTPSSSFEARYQVQDSRSELPAENLETRYTNHRINLKGARSLADERGDVSLEVSTNRKSNSTRIAPEVGLGYLLPIFGGFVLDDTPEILDPLEDDPVSASALFDNDLDTPTAVAIGDAAPPVREFGGDFRNLVYDFGEQVTISAARITVDSYLNLPEFMHWSVYLSDDPDGREWGAALSEAAVSITYQEWETGRQGWEIVLAAPATARWFKVVNTKTGLTADQLNVTELEVFGPQEETRSGDVVYQHLVKAETRWQLTSRLEGRYFANLDLRRGGGSDRRQDGLLHGAELSYDLGAWRASASQQMDRREVGGEVANDATRRLVSLQTADPGPWRCRLSYSHLKDQGSSRDQTTQNVALSVTWQAAPQLTLLHQSGYGKRSDQAWGSDADSWFTQFTVRGNPRPSLQLDVERLDRWVSATAGSGFTSFNNTRIQFSWSILPRLGLTGLNQYQLRGDVGSWLHRHNLTWGLLQEGDMKFSLFLSDYRDTVNDRIQFGGGVNFAWQARSRLVFEGGTSQLNIRQAGVERDATNYHLRGRWHF